MKMKRTNVTNPKLALKREFVRILTNTDLQIVIGAVQCGNNISEHSKISNVVTDETTCQ